MQNIHPLGFLLIATTLEVSGDALVRMAIYKHVGLTRIALVVIGATLLLGYGFAVNLAPLEFGQVVGLYIATLFIVWQVINLIAFRTFPNDCDVLETRIFKVAHYRKAPYPIRIPH